MTVPFRIQRGGKVFEAKYAVVGPYLIVTSAYGTRRVVLGLVKPVKLARGLLGAMIRDATAMTPIVSATFAIAAPASSPC